MNKKIKNYVDVLFSDIPKTVDSIELKEELLSNMNASMDDYLSDGLSENQAYSKVISNIGDIDELLAQLPKNGEKDSFISARKNKNLFYILISIGVFMILIGVGVFPLLESIAGEEIAIVNFFVLIGIGVALFIYAASLNEKTITFEESKEKEDDKYKAIKDLVWSITVLLFFVSGFLFNNWNAWVLFPIVGILMSMVETLIKIVRG